MFLMGIVILNHHTAAAAAVAAAQNAPVFVFGFGCCGCGRRWLIVVWDVCGSVYRSERVSRTIVECGGGARMGVNVSGAVNFASAKCSVSGWVTHVQDVSVAIDGYLTE